MHETKFRAWLKADNRYLEADEYNQLFLRPDGRLLWWSYVGGFEDVTAKFEIEWFTDLRDKNGTEIYEGDIVEFEYYDDDLKGLKSFGEVFWNNASHAWGLRRKGKLLVRLEGYHSYKVIGNIHQHPELLEQANE